MADASDSRTPLSELVSLKGRTAVVTGGGAGIGRAIAYRLAEAGATVVIGDLDESAAARVAAELPPQTPAHLGTGVDVADAASVSALAERAVAHTGQLNIWVNNAGVFPVGSALEISGEDWDRVLNINLRGTYFGAREAALRMEPGRGVIINLASTASFNCGGGINPAHYVASKHGVAGLTKSLAVELGPKGIRVAAVAPTMTESDGVRAMRQLSDEVNSALDQYGRSLPIGRSAQPDDIAKAALFLATDLAGIVTGSIVLADGGDLAR